MRRKIVEIDNNLYLMDFANNSFLKVEKIEKYHPEHDLTLFCCIIKEEEKVLQHTQQTYISRTTKWGAFNTDKEEIIPCTYEYIRFYGWEFLEVSMLNPANSTDNFYFEMDTNGVPCYRYTSKKDRTTHVVKFIGYQAISKFTGGLAVGLKNGYQGIVRWDGSVFWEAKYDYVNIRNVNQKCIIVKKDGRLITILYFENLKCWKNLPFDYSFLKYDKLEKQFLIKKEDKVGVLDFSNKMLIPPIYVDLVFEKNIIIATNSQNKKGIIKRSDYKTILLEFEYDEIKSRNLNHSLKNLIIVKNNLQGICTWNGEILVEPIWNKDIKIYPETYAEGLIGFRNFKTSKSGFINLTGEVILLLGYDDSFNGGFKDGKVNITYCSSFGEYFVKTIDKQGNVLETKNTGRYKRYCNDDTDYREETWYAMTDGMYGDYQGGNIDYENYGF